MNHRQGQWGCDFSPDEIAACRRRGGLLSLELELSRACNLRCIYCYAEAGDPLPGELTDEEIFSVCAQAAELGARRVIVLGGGEPLMHPRALDVMAWLRKRNITPDLFTNGLRVTAETAARLKELQAAVVVKLNSFDPDVQDRLAGVKGAAARMRAGLENLLAAGYPGKNTPLGVQSVVCRQNIAELPQIWRWARGRGITPYFEMLTMQGRACDHLDLAVAPEEAARLFAELARIDREQFGREWEPTPPLAGLNCRRHEYSCTVSVTGEVHPCPGVDVSCGNVRETPLAEILAQSPVIADLRDVRNRIKGACRECEHNGACYGCRGSAFQLTGDYLAADPLCWRVAEKDGKK